MVRECMFSNDTYVPGQWWAIALMAKPHTGGSHDLFQAITFNDKLLVASPTACVVLILDIDNRAVDRWDTLQPT